MVGVAQWLRRQVVALKIEGSIPSTHPKSALSGKFLLTIIRFLLALIFYPRYNCVNNCLFND